MTKPKNLKKWLVAIGILYLVFPRDLVPDFIGRGLGLIDDVLLIGLLTYFYRKHLRKYMAREAGDREGKERHGAAGRPSDPYEILGIDSSASAEEVHAAYKARMHEYHPDKVAHLGEELQEMAHRKSVEIQQAYDRLRN